MTYELNCCDDGSGSTVGTVIRFDNVTILADPSWIDSKVTYEDSVRYWSNIIPEVDIILLSQPTAEYLGAYAFLYRNFLSHFLFRIKVYSTLPVANLGRVSTIDLYVSRGMLGPVQSSDIDLTDIEKAFDSIQTVKYSQSVDLKAVFDGLSFMAFNSGTKPGGCAWCINTYSEKLIYAPEWNHSRSTILDAASFLDSNNQPLSSLSKPSAVITKLHTFGSPAPLRKRSNVFKDSVARGLDRNGTVIIPVSMGGNFLELFVQVHDFLYENSRDRFFAHVPVFLVSYSRGRALTYAKSMLEWLSSNVLKTWEGRNNKTPFDLNKQLRVVLPDELSKHPGAKICFVSEVDTLINETVSTLTQLEGLTVLLASTTFQDIELLNKMYDKWEKLSKERSLVDGTSIVFSSSLDLKNVTYSPFDKDSLEQYKAMVKERRDKMVELETNFKNEMKKSSNFTGTNNSTGGVGDFNDEELDEDDDEDEDHDALLGILKNRTAGKQSVSKPIPLDMFVSKASAPKHKMFPFRPITIKYDDYGAVVKFDQFIPKEEKDISIVTKRAVQASDDDEDDPYVLADVNSIKPKRARKDGNAQEAQEQKDNFDNIDYLDSLYEPRQRKESISEVHLKCSFTFINLETLADKRSASVIWPAFKPRKLIVLAPKEKSSEHLIDVLRKRNVATFEMPLNKSIEFNTTIRSLDVSIDPELDAELTWQRVSDGHTVAHVIGRLVEEELYKNSSTPLQKSKLVLKPLHDRRRVHTGVSISIGDIRLAELKRRLTGLHHVAEFKGEGVLVVDGEIAVRKISDGETIIDGTPSELYTLVKQCITDMLAKI